MLNDWSRGKQLILFPENLKTKSIVSLGTSPQVICFIAHEKNFFVYKFTKINLAGSQHFADNSALLPSDIIDFATLPSQRFWRKTVSLLDVM